jgi:hypothetical protein
LLSLQYSKVGVFNIAEDNATVSSEKAKSRLAWSAVQRLLSEKWRKSIGADAAASAGCAKV